MNMKKSQTLAFSKENNKVNSNSINIPQEMLTELKASFDLFDTDHSGCIDTKQLKQAMIALGFETHNSSIFRMIAQLDSDGNGVITFQEWVQLMTTKSASTQDKKHYQKIFKLFDNQNCGYICCNRLLQVANQLGEDIRYEQAVEMLKRADIDSDGLISFEEFYSIMTKNIKE